MGLAALNVLKTEYASNRTCSQIFPNESGRGRSRRQLLSFLNCDLFRSALIDHASFLNLLDSPEKSANLDTYKELINRILNQKGRYQINKAYRHMPSIEFILFEVGAKQNLRTIIPDTWIPWIEYFCDLNNAFFLIFPSRIQQLPNSQKQGFSNVSYGLDSSQQEEKGRLIVYITRHLEQALQMLVSELDQDHITLGRLLDYPRCCIDFFVTNLSQANSIWGGDFVPITLENSYSYSPFPFQTNNIVRYWNISLLSHFPCSYSCCESIRLGTSYHESLAQHYPQGAKTIARDLSCPVLYTEDEGVFHIAQWDHKSKSLKYSPEIIEGTTQESSFAKALLKSNCIWTNGSLLRLFCNHELIAERKQSAWLIRFSGGTNV